LCGLLVCWVTVVVEVGFGDQIIGIWGRIEKEIVGDIVKKQSLFDS
jgi:hypothetical protein